MDDGRRTTAVCASVALCRVFLASNDNELMTFSSPSAAVCHCQPPLFYPILIIDVIDQRGRDHSLEIRDWRLESTQPPISNPQSPLLEATNGSRQNID